MSKKQMSSFLMKKQIMMNAEERELRLQKISRSGEIMQFKNNVPTRMELREEVDELINLVHGACVARIQLGFQDIDEQEWNLTPLIKDLERQVGPQKAPLPIDTKPGPSKTQKIPGAMPYNSQLSGSFKGLTPSGSASGLRHDSQNPVMNFRNPGRTRSVGEPSPQDKKQQAEDFVRRLKKDKRDREAQQRMMTQAKDNQFLSKLQETLNNRQRVRNMQEKDKQMNHNNMLKKMDMKKQQRMKELSNLQNKQSKRRMETNNQYQVKPPLAPLAQMHEPDTLPFGVNANAVNLHNFENQGARGVGGKAPITKLTQQELNVVQQNYQFHNKMSNDKMTNDIDALEQVFEKSAAQRSLTNINVQKQKLRRDSNVDILEQELQYQNSSSGAQAAQNEAPFQFGGNIPEPQYEEPQYDELPQDYTALPENDYSQIQYKNPFQRQDSDQNNNNNMPPQRDFLIRRSDIYADAKAKKAKYKSAFYQQIKADEAQKKQDQDSALQKKQDLLNRKKEFGRLVNQEYLPPTSYKKKEELSQNIEKLNNYNKRKMHLQNI